MSDPAKPIRRLVLALLLAAFSAGSSAAEQLRYVLTPDFERGFLRVRIDWKTEGRTRSGLRVAESWGRIKDVPALLKHVAFVGGKVRRDGALWVISHRRGATITCTYEVDPGRTDFSDWQYTHHPITTPKFFHGMGNAFLLVPAPGGGQPDQYETVLRWQLPAGAKAVCSWGGAGRAVGALIKPTDLRHSIYLAGRIKTHRAQRGKKSVTVAMVDRFEFTPEQLEQMATRIIDAQTAFMGDADFPDFVVTAIPVGKKLKPGDSRLAGTGLYHSFALFVAPGAVLNAAVEHLFSHELFHYWNGRMLAAKQPERLVFWFVEGLTDYYALRILHESGIWNARTYAHWINRHLREYAANPAIHATNEQIEKDYWNARDTVGEIPYQRGLLLGLRWHRLARDNGVPDGLDHLFKRLVARGRASALRVTNAGVRRAGVDLLGPWFAADFDRYVVAAQTIDVPADALRPALAGEYVELAAFKLGFDRTRSARDKKLIGLVPGSAAQRAGLREGDALLGWNLSKDPDQKVRIKVRRGSVEKTIEYYPRGENRAIMQFKPAERPR